MKPTHKLLSVEGWRDGSGWTWNDWFDTKVVATLAPDVTTRQLLRHLRAVDILTPASIGGVRVEEYDFGNGTQYEIQIRGSGRPILALEPIEE